MLKITVVFVFLALICSVSFAAAPDELVLYMSFDKNTVNADKTVIDLSKYGNNGIMLGAPKVAAGHKGEALDFNGASDGVEIKTSDSLAKTAKQISMEAWIFPRLDAQIEIITKWDGVANGIIHFEIQAGGIIRYCMRRVDPANAAADIVMVDLKTPGGKFKLNEWTHIAETYDGKTARIYVNGAEVLNGACAGEMRDNKDTKWWIGCLYGTQGRWFGGLIDEVRIWSKVLTPDEVKKAMDGTLVSNIAVEKENKLPTVWGQLKNDQ